MDSHPATMLSHPKSLMAASGTNTMTHTIRMAWKKSVQQTALYPPRKVYRMMTTPPIMMPRVIPMSSMSISRTVPQLWNPDAT